MRNRDVKKNMVEEYMRSHFEVILTEVELEDIMELATKQDSFEANYGHKHERVKTNPREKAFSDQWLLENYPQPGVNYGHGILQDLFIDSPTPFTRVMIHEINARDRMIAATVVQWLGTNVGMSFLSEAIARFKARIVFDK